MRAVYRPGARALNDTVCILVNSLGLGGAEQVVATLAPAFARRGRKVNVLCLERDSVHALGSVPVDYLSDPGAGGPLKALELIGQARRLKAYVARHGAGLVQSHIYRANYVNVLARLLGSRHRVQLVNHGMPGQFARTHLKGRVNRWLVRALYPRADQVVCPSQGMLEEFVGLGLPRNLLACIPNPVDLAKLRRDAQRLAGRTRPGRDYLVALGRMVPLKRMTDIVEAFATLAPDHPGLDLVLAGEGPERGRIETTIRKAGLQDRVGVLGRLDNPFPLLAGARALVSASESEGFSLVLVYALALGVPVVATDCSAGPREILAPGQGAADYGLLVPVANPPALADALRAVLDDAALAHRLREAGPQRAADFDLERIVPQYLAAMNGLAGA